MCSKYSGLNCNNTAPPLIDADDEITPTSEDFNTEVTASDDEGDD